jgi:hypothetical protein
MADIAPYDIDAWLVWGGSLQFTDNGDLRMAETIQDIVQQHISRRLLTNPVEKDSFQNVVVVGDDPFNQDYGAGLGRDVDIVDDATAREARIKKVRQAVFAEPLVDHDTDTEVDIFDNPQMGVQLIRVKFNTIEGQPTSFGLAT